MSRPIRGTPEADAEFADAVRWYEEQQANLGRDFLAAVREARTLIAEHPEVGAGVRGSRHGARRLMIRRFPYQLIYYVRAQEIVLVAVAHTRRKPGYWKKRPLPPAT